MADEIVYIIHREWEAKGESRFFFDVDKPLSRTQLLERMAKEYSRGNCIFMPMMWWQPLWERVN